MDLAYNRIGLKDLQRLDAENSQHNICLRKPTKNRGFFPYYGAMLKLFILALSNINLKLSMPFHHCKAALTRSIIKNEKSLFRYLLFALFTKFSTCLRNPIKNA